MDGLSPTPALSFNSPAVGFSPAACPRYSPSLSRADSVTSPRGGFSQPLNSFGRGMSPAVVWRVYTPMPGSDRPGTPRQSPVPFTAEKRDDKKDEDQDTDMLSPVVVKSLSRDKLSLSKPDSGDDMKQLGNGCNYSSDGKTPMVIALKSDSVVTWAQGRNKAGEKVFCISDFRPFPGERFEEALGEVYQKVCANLRSSGGAVGNPEKFIVCAKEEQAKANLVARAILAVAKIDKNEATVSVLPAKVPQLLVNTEGLHYGRF